MTLRKRGIHLEGSRSACECAYYKVLLLSTTLSLYFRNQVISHLVTIEEMASQTRTMVPFQVLAEIDNGKNPMQLTTERIERAAAENQFMNGKIAALDVSPAHYPGYILICLRSTVLSRTINSSTMRFVKVFRSFQLTSTPLT